MNKGEISLSDIEKEHEPKFLNQIQMKSEK